MSTSGTQDSWVTLTTSYISNLSSYTGFDVRYLTANQTITLSGIVTGIGTTAITTAIADAALSIAKTSGLQTALDAKMSNYTGTVGQVLTWDALSGGVPNFMNLDHKPLKLNINEIAVGNEFGLLESRSEFKYLNSLMSIGNKTNTTKYTSFGMTSPTGEHGLIKVFGGGSLHLDGVGVKVNHLGNSTIFERVVTVDQNGYLSAKVLDASGNTAQGLDSVLSVSNLATNRSIILNSTTGVNISNLSFHRNSVDAGGLIHSPTYNSNAGAIGLYAKVNAVLELATDSGDILIIPGGSLRLGDLSTTRKVYINNTAYNLNDAGNFAAGGWNNQQGGLSPANGDAVILIWNSSKNCFVLNHVKTNAPGSYDVTKKYLTID